MFEQNGQRATRHRAKTEKQDFIRKCEHYVMPVPAGANPGLQPGTVRVWRQQRTQDTGGVMAAKPHSQCIVTISLPQSIRATAQVLAAMAYYSCHLELASRSHSARCLVNQLRASL